jgi:hypothetical protein
MVSKQMEDNFEQLAWMLDGKFVIVHLTAYLNKYTMLPYFSHLFTVF